MRHLTARAYDNSLFSGRLKRSTHVRSGATAQWRKLLSPPVRERFQTLYPDVLQRLGYADDDAWVYEDRDECTSILGPRQSH